MPRIHDSRHDRKWLTAMRAVFFLVACTAAGVALHFAGNLVGATNSAFHRYREPAVMPHVFVQGELQNRAGTARVDPPLCFVEHERWMSCGKTHCWSPIEAFTRSDARIIISHASSPLPDQMELGPSFRFEPWQPSHRQIVTSSVDENRWRTFAKVNRLGFEDSGFRGTSTDRIVTNCAQDGEPIYVEACVSPTKPGVLEPCPGDDIYGVVVNGDGQAALDDAADHVAGLIGGAALALLLATLVWLRIRRPIMGALEDRAAPHRKTLGAAWALFVIPPLVGMWTLLMHASHPPSTWSTGRGGFAFALSMLVAWLFFALQRWLHRRRLLFALAPVLATPRSLLAEANGTVELAVKARGNDLRSFIGDEEIAFSEVVIAESFRSGRNLSTREVYRGRLRDHLAVVDESGEGRLDLSNAVLDVEQHTLTMPTLSPRYLERGISVHPHPTHVSYIIKEWVIKDGEPLYVFGDVSDIALQASEGGYRTVRGAPTLGGKDAAPVLVHSGDERGLVALLTREARVANSYAVVAACMCTALAATLVALARI